MLLSQPEPNLVIPGKAVRVVEFFLQRWQGSRGETLAARGQGLLIAQGVVETTLGIGAKPRGDTGPMHAQ